MRRHIPNALTISRIVITVLLYPILLAGWRDLFLALFIVAAFTDLIDGYLARKFKATSALGAKLDSIADYLFFGSVPVWLFLKLPTPVVYQYLTPFFAMVIMSVIYFVVRFNTPSTFFHLPSAKLASATVFVASVLLLFGYVRAWIVWIAVCMIIIAELEELAIIARVNARPRVKL